MGPTSNNYTSELHILLCDKDTGEEHKIPISSIPVIEDITTQPDNDVVFKATWPGRGISRDTMNDIHTRISQVLSDFIKNTAIVFHTDDVFRMGCTCINYASFGIRSDDSRVLHLAKRVLAEQVRVRIAPIFDPTVQAEQVHKALETCANNPDDDRCKQCPYGCLYNCSPAYQEALDYINKLEYDIAMKKLAMNSVYGKDPVLETIADKINYAIQKQWYEELAKMSCGGLTVKNEEPTEFTRVYLCKRVESEQNPTFKIIKQEKEKTTMSELRAWGSDARMNLVPQIVDVYFNEKKGATTVRWADGTVTTVKLMQGDTYDRENGFMRCVMKKLFEERNIDPKTGEPTKDDRPNKYRRVIKGWLKADDIRKEKEAKAAAKKAEKKAKKEAEATKKVKTCFNCGFNTEPFPDSGVTCSCKETCVAWNRWIERPVVRSCETCGCNKYPNPKDAAVCYHAQVCVDYDKWTPREE